MTAATNSLPPGATEANEWVLDDPEIPEVTRTFWGTKRGDSAQVYILRSQSGDGLVTEGAFAIYE